MNVVRTLMLAIVVAAAVGCQSSPQTTQTPAREPAFSASTTDAPTVLETPVPESEQAQELMERFTEVLWPAINNYNRHPGQGSYPTVNPAYSQFWDLLDRGLSDDEWKQVTSAAGDLAGVNGDDFDAIRLSDLTPAYTRITALNPPEATLVVCYTYTVGQKHRHPAVSEVTIGLHKTDDWYLKTITNDHTVPDCRTAT